MNDIMKRSGNIHDERILVIFLYKLMRDHLTPGIVESIVNGIEYEIFEKKANHRYPKDKYMFCNGWLARYAQDVANRLAQTPQG